MKVEAEPLPSRMAAWVQGWNAGFMSPFDFAPAHWPPELVAEFDEGKAHGNAYDETLSAAKAIARLSTVADFLEHVPTYMPETEVW